MPGRAGRGVRLDPHSASGFALDLGPAVCWKAALLGVLANHRFVRSDVDAVDLVPGNVALHPLNLRTQVAQDAARLLGDSMKLLGGKRSRSGNLTLDHILGHALSFNRH